MSDELRAIERELALAQGMVTAGLLLLEGAQRRLERARRERNGADA